MAFAFPILPLYFEKGNCLFQNFPVCFKICNCFTHAGEVNKHANDLILWLAHLRFTHAGDVNKHRGRFDFAVILCAVPGDGQATSKNKKAETGQAEIFCPSGLHAVM